jgi:hypothetical protein
MKRLLSLGSLIAVAALALLCSRTASTAPAETAAVKLWNSLNAEQQKQALLPYDNKDKYKEEFPAVNRPGLPFTKLTKEQKALVNEAVRAVTSEYGAERVLELAKQTPDQQRFLTFFGTPGKDKQFAWRMAQHHLTLLYVEFGSEAPREFGPLLLGGNPVKNLWDAEDQLFLKLYAALTAEERQNVAKGKGLRIGELNDRAKALAHKLLQQRSLVLAPEYQKVFDHQLKNDGGRDKLYLSIQGNGSKSHHQGGNYHWSLAGEHVLCNWQTVGGEHIHMTLHARPAKTAG